MWIFGQGGPCRPSGQEIVWSHRGREYLSAECSHSLGLQTEKHLALYQSKHPLLSPCLSLSPILLIDSREENTQAHTQRRISPPSSGYGTPTDMKTLRLLLRRTWEAWHRMKGNPSYRKNTGNSQNARWPFRADWMGFSPWPSTQHTQTHPTPLCAAFLPSGNFSLSAELTVWCRSFYICLPVYIHPLPSSSFPPPPPPPASPSLMPSVSFFTRTVEQSICRKALRYHVSLWNMWYRLWPVHVYSIILLYCSDQESFVRRNIHSALRLKGFTDWQT